MIHFDEATLKAIDRVAPTAKRQRADFIRKAVEDALYKLECERMREAYRLQSDLAMPANRKHQRPIVDRTLSAKEATSAWPAGAKSSP